MQQSDILRNECKLAAERSNKHWGTASVDIYALDFPSTEDKENVQSLVGLFREDFQGLNPKYHIPAKINRQDLDAALQISGVTLQELSEGPAAGNGHPNLIFPPGFRLQCLRGRSRAEAAKRALPPRARRWVVDLFHPDIDPALETTLIEEYSAEKDPDHGELYCKIRHYQGYGGPGNRFLEKRWWARLEYISKSKTKSTKSHPGAKSKGALFNNLKQIFRNPEFRAEFDVQLDIPGLSSGMILTVTHKMFADWCHDLCLHYLRFNRNVWAEGVCANDPDTMRRIDPDTVKAVEGTAPGSCQKDREKLYAKLHSGEIFGEFSEQERGIMWERLLSVGTNRLIPSFSTFFEDLNWLEGPLGCLSKFVRRFPGETMNRALSRIYTGVNQEPGYVKIQEPDSAIALVPGEDADRIDLGIRQGWMIAMRRWTDIPPKRKKRDCILRENPAYKENPKAIHEIAALLFELGFESEEIRNVLRVSPESVIAENALLEARPPAQFSYESSDFESYKNLMMRCFQTAKELPREELVITAESKDVTDSPTRHGKPSMVERKQTNPLLFADKLHSLDDFEEITPFFVRKSVYLAFFGMPDFNHAVIGTRRRLQPGSEVTYEEGREILRQGQFHEGQRQLEEMRSSLDESRRILEEERTILKIETQQLEGEKQKVGQDRENINKEIQERLATEKMRLIEKFNSKLSITLENEMKRLTKNMNESFQKQLGDERDKIRLQLTQGLNQKYNQHIELLKGEIQQLRQEEEKILQEGQQRLEEEKKAQRDHQQLLEEDNRRLEAELLLYRDANENQEEDQQHESGKNTRELEIQQLREEKERFQLEAEKQLKERMGLEEQLRRDVEQRLAERGMLEEKIQLLEEENTKHHEEAQQHLEQQKTSQQQAQDLAKEEKKHYEDQLQQALKEKEKVLNEFQEVKVKLEELLQDLEQQKISQQQAQDLVKKEKKHCEDQFEQTLKEKEKVLNELQGVKVKLEEQLQHLEQEKEKSLLEAQLQFESERASLQQAGRRLQKEVMKARERCENSTEGLHREKEQLGQERQQLERERKQVETEKSRLEQDREMLLKERNELNEGIQNLLRDKVEMKKEQGQLKQQEELEMQGSHLLPLPSAIEGQKASQSLPPSAKTGENSDKSSGENPALSAESRLSAAVFLRRFGRQADEAREKRRRLDDEGMATVVQNRQSGEKEKREEKTNGEELLTLWQARKGLIPTIHSRGTRGIGALRRNRTTQIRLQDAVVSLSPASDENNMASTKGLSVTFIIKENGEAREEIVLATEVERTAWQYKKEGYDIYDKNGFTLSPASCYEDVTGDGSRAIVVHPSSRLTDGIGVGSRKRQADQVE